MRFPRFFRREEKANPTGASLVVTMGNGFSKWNSRKAFVEEGYQRNPIIYMVVEEIAKAIAGLSIELKRGEDYIEDHPVLDLLKRPNPMMGGDVFRKAIFIDYLVQGEMAIVQPRGQAQPVELWPVDPSEVEIKPSKTGVPAAYIHKRNGVETEFPVRNVVSNPRADMFFMKMHNPTDYWRGQSPLVAGGIAGDIHNKGSDWNYNLLKNSARPSGMFSFDGDPGPDAITRLKEWIETNLSGSRNAGRPGVLVKGKFEPMSLNPKDMDFATSMTEAKKMIAGVYGVPLPLIDNEAATFANMEAAKERFYVDTVLPLANSWLNAFGNWLLPAFGDDELELCIDMDDIPALEAVRNRKFDRVMKALNANLITVDEARDEIGYDPIDPDELDPAEEADRAYGGGATRPT